MPELILQANLYNKLCLINHNIGVNKYTDIYLFIITYCFYVFYLNIINTIVCTIIAHMLTISIFLIKGKMGYWAYLYCIFHYYLCSNAPTRKTSMCSTNLLVSTSTTNIHVTMCSANLHATITCVSTTHTTNLAINNCDTWFKLYVHLIIYAVRTSVSHQSGGLHYIVYYITWTLLVYTCSSVYTILSNMPNICLLH